MLKEKKKTSQDNMPRRRAAKEGAVLLKHLGPSRHLHLDMHVCVCVCVCVCVWCVCVYLSISGPVGATSPACPHPPSPSFRAHTAAALSHVLRGTAPPPRLLLPPRAHMYVCRCMYHVCVWLRVCNVHIYISIHTQRQTYIYTYIYI